MSTSILTWIAAILTIGIFSFLWRDNPFYKFCEHLFVGVSVGYTIAITWYNSVYPDLFDPLFLSPLSKVSLGSKLLLIIPLLLGLCYFCRFIPQVSWLIRFPMAFVLGWASGVVIPAMLQTNVLKQMQGTFLTPGIFARWDVFLWAVISFIGVVCSVLYFFFSREHKGALKVASETGIVFLMVGFGASFGYTVMARMSLLIGRFQFLLRDWLGMIQ
ncbi:hypothetical protein JXD38_00685 [candidate division WOR-3 bacterium]|nr:hypothetical protein [candidate division WOR-3 bacterium]